MTGNVAKPKDAGWGRQRPLGVNSALELQRVAPKATVEPSHYNPPLRAGTGHLALR
jgi:hypothetical protein